MSIGRWGAVTLLAGTSLGVASLIAQQAQRLQTPAEIERLAREQFNMVLPNEQAYTVLSSDATTTTTTQP